MSKKPALAAIRTRSTKEVAGPAPAKKIAHELQVHQLELEMQNDELRRTQGELAESRDRFYELFEFAPVGFLTLAANGTITSVNIAGAEQLACGRKVLLGRRFADFVTPADHARWYQFSVSLRQSPDVPRLPGCALLFKRADGTEFSALIQGRCMRIGKDIELQLTLADLDAANRQMNAELRISAVAFEAQESMVITDAAGVIVKVNRAFIRMTGYDAADVVGHKMSMLRSGRHDAAFYTAMWESIRREGTWRGEIWDKRRNGEDYPLWLTITAVRGESGSITHYVGTLTDITTQVSQRERMEHELGAYTLRLNQASRQLLAVQEETRRRLAADLHDRTKPNLAAVAINLQMIERGLGADAGEMLDRLSDTRALLDDTEASLREICAELRPVTLDYAGLAFTLEGYAQQFARRTGIEVTHDIHYAAGSLDAGIESVLFRICQEALTNVAKHAQAHSVKITLDARTRPIVMGIVDDGRGFDMQTLSQPGRTASLGLVNMREMAAITGAHLSISSQPGKGTQVWVNIYGPHTHGQ